MRTPTLKTIAQSLTAVAMGVTMISGGAALASAAPGRGHGFDRNVASGRLSRFDYSLEGRGGYVTAVTGTSVTVESLSGLTTTFALTPTTTYREGDSPTSIGSLVVGDRIHVAVSATAPQTATAVTIELAELMGVVTGVNANTVSIRSDQGFTRTIIVSPTTTYREGGSSTTLSSVAVGSRIEAQGTIDANGVSLDALNVLIDANIHRETFRGVVQSFTSSSVTVLSSGGVIETFAFTTATTFKSGDVTLTAGSLAAGQHVTVSFDSAAATTALNVSIELAKVTGTVASIAGDLITLSGGEGFSRPVLVSGQTTYVEKGKSATLANISVGTRIRAEGTVAADLITLDALRVTISPSRDRNTPAKGSNSNHSNRKSPDRTR